MTKFQNLIFEIGTEELPPNSILSIASQIKDTIIKSLSELFETLDINSIKIFTTPRRIAIYIPKLPEKEIEREVEIKGPPKNKAFDLNNSPTEIGIGFAKKYNLDPKKLPFKEFNGADYIYLNVKTGGKNTKELLKDILYKSLKNTTGEKFMKWGNHDEKFSRPIRWILALFGNEKISFSFAGVNSDGFTYGHRFLSKGKINITNPEEYESALLKEGHVIVDRDKRQKKIIDLIESEAKNIFCKATINKELLDEVTNITEFPESLLCKFEEKYLTLPHIVTETVLQKHQRYFVLTDKSTKELKPYFIVITNGYPSKEKEAKENIIKGNEKVARARLNDAVFFFEEDLKKIFNYESRIESLSKISFQKNLGSMKDKVERLVKFSTLIYDTLFPGIDKTSSSINKEITCSKKDVIETAKLCKLDLASQIVFEMPELQGSIGKIYAKKNGFSETISHSIEECQTNTSKELTTAHIVGIADRLDNLISLFSIGKIPTSSADPFALRGQVNWIINFTETIEHQYNIAFNLENIINLYKNTFSTFNSKVTDEVTEKVKGFIIERIKLLWKNDVCNLEDLINSVFSTAKPLENISLTKEKVLLLNKSFFPDSTENENKTFLIAAKRLVRIVEKNTNGNINLSLLKNEEEKNLLNAFEKIEKSSFSSLNNYFLALRELTTPINLFFDKVLVNDPDPEIKKTRHALLNKGKALLEKVCNFNEIIDRN